MPLSDLVRRPELTLPMLLEELQIASGLCPRLLEALETEFKFSGYLWQQEEEIRKIRQAENQLIPEEFDYDRITGLRIEIRDKLKARRPSSLGQAQRIPGMTPGALSLLAIHLKRHNSRRKSVENAKQLI